MADVSERDTTTAASFGVAVACAGDANGDGYADLVIGAHNQDNSEINEGNAFVYYGSATGIDPGGIDPMVKHLGLSSAIQSLPPS